VVVVVVVSGTVTLSGVVGALEPLEPPEPDDWLPVELVLWLD
jgi:hypothetical protein